MDIDNDHRVLSIQSHVVSGYCGNKSAVFPLQTLGFDVDFINSVQFSTHTGYPRWTGQVLNEQDIFELIDGLRHNNLLCKYTHLLSGYARSASFLEAMHSAIKEIKSVAPNVVYLCDPVLGDDGRMYVPHELLSVYKEKIIPLADIICPNQFEAELLSGIKITGMKTALEAIDYLHSLGIKTVVISSTETGFDDTNEQLMTIGSSQLPGANNQDRQLCKLVIPRIPSRFTGTGDLFAALFLAWFTKTKFDLKITMENVTATLNSIIRRTYEYANNKPNGLELPFNRELRIIQSRDDILEPKIQNSAELI
ncbi:pyridoxal kinase [Dermatophagoides farinae]|uniref:pyridoxal kinase n=1 Tax=Dermatophagoides farinae TaxID=6954 RepID=UPI003F608923